MKNPIRSAIEKIKSYGTTFAPPWLRSVGGMDYAPQRQVSPEILNAVTVARCIGVIADQIASCPIVVEKRVGRGKWEQIESDSTEFRGLARIFERPNPDQGGAELTTLHHAAKHSFGRAYLLLDYVNGGAGYIPGRSYPRELRFLQPNAVEPIYSTDPRIHYPLKYRYTPTGGTPVLLDPAEVLVDRLPSALDPLNGQSPAVGAAFFALIENVLGWYHWGYFKNGARAGLVVASDQRLTKQQLLEQRDSWNEQHAIAAGKAFATVFTSAGMKVQEMQAGRKEGDFLDLFKCSKQQVYTAYGVPPALAGDFEHATFANVEEQTPLFMEQTCFPRTRVTEGQYALQLTPRFDPTEKARVRYAWEQTPAMKRRAIERAKAYVTLTGVPILTPDEAREREGLPPLPNGAGKVLYIPFSMSPAGLEPEPAPAPAAPAPKPGEDPKDPEKGYRRKWIDDPVRHEKRARARKSMSRFIPQAERELKRFLDNQEARLLAKIEAADPGKAQKVTGGELFDEQFEAEATRSVLVRIYARILSTRGPEAFEDVASSGSFTMDHSDVTEWLRRHAYDNGSLITGTTADNLAEVVATFVESGQTTQELTDAIRALYDVRRDEAQRIARTEVSSSYNFATHNAWKQSGVVAKREWLTSHDDAVRDSHAAIDGEVVGMEEKYSNGLAFPGDPEGDADEVIQCRCVELPVKDEPAPESEERGYKASPDLLALFAAKSG